MTTQAHLYKVGDLLQVARKPYGPCPGCDGCGSVMLMRGPEPAERVCNVCGGTGWLDEFGCPANAKEPINES